MTEFSLDPLTNPPRRIFCAAVNYVAHRDEMKHQPNDRPMIFLRTGQSLCPSPDHVIKPAQSSQYDYEGELALIIGKAGRAIPREKALDHIYGWTCFLDGTARDWQNHSSQFTAGKNFDDSGAIGPRIVSARDFGDYRAHHLRVRLNDVEVQSTPISLMLFDVETLIAYISQFTQLCPGDVIATGTCGGVGVKRSPPLFMWPGDVIEIEIDGIGVLRRQVIAGPQAEK